MGVTKNNAFKIALIDLSDDTSVAAAGNNTQTLQAPAGKIYQVIGIEYLAPAPIGAGAGEHTLTIYSAIGTDSQQTKMAVLNTVFGSTLAIGFTNNFVAATVESPSVALEQRAVCTDILWCSHTYTIHFKYDNDTDVAQTGTRTLNILVKVFDEVL